MVNTADNLEDKLRQKIGADKINHLTVADLSDGCGEKFKVICASEIFQGVPLLKRHRMIHEYLEEEMKTIHALELKTWTPAQYEKRKGAN